MSYATVQDMIDRFGETEMIRLSEPEDRTAEAVLDAKVEKALADATALINDYVRGRYAVPIAAPGLSVVRAACILARYDLAKGERTFPTEQMEKDRKEIVAWLEGIAAGRINLDAPAASASGSAGIRVRDRDSMFSPEQMKGW